MNKRNIGFHNLNKPKREFAIKANRVDSRNNYILSQIYKTSLNELQLKNILKFSPDCLKNIEQPVSGRHLSALTEAEFLKLLFTPKVLVKIMPEQTFKNDSKIIQSFILLAAPPKNLDNSTPPHNKFIPMQLNLIKNKGGSIYDYSIVTYALNTNILSDDRKATYLPLTRLELSPGIHINYDGNKTQNLHMHFATYENIQRDIVNSYEDSAKKFCLSPYAISFDLNNAIPNLPTESEKKIPLSISLQFMLDILNVQNAGITNFKEPVISSDLPLSTVFTKPKELTNIFSKLSTHPMELQSSVTEIKNSISAFSKQFRNVIYRAALSVNNP